MECVFGGMEHNTAGTRRGEATQAGDADGLGRSRARKDLQPLGSPPMIPTAASDHGPSTSRRCCSGRSARRQAGWTASWLIAGGDLPRWSRSRRARRRSRRTASRRSGGGFACSGPRRTNLCQRLQMSLMVAGEAQHEIRGPSACVGGKPLRYPGNGARIDRLPAPQHRSRCAVARLYRIRRHRRVRLRRDPRVGWEFWSCPGGTGT